MKTIDQITITEVQSEMCIRREQIDALNADYQNKHATLTNQLRAFENIRNQKLAVQAEEEKALADAAAKKKATAEVDRSLKVLKKEAKAAKVAKTA